MKKRDKRKNEDGTTLSVQNNFYDVKGLNRATYDRRRKHKRRGKR